MAILTFTGYMIEGELDDGTLTVRGKNRAARVALAGKDHDRPVVIPLAEIESVTAKDATRMVNGNLKIAMKDGRTVQLHFRRKHQADLDALRGALAP